MDEELTKRINTVKPILNERQLRQYLGAEAESLGFGGIEKVAKITDYWDRLGIDRNLVPEFQAMMRGGVVPPEDKEKEKDLLRIFLG